jgi:hypothetical protein
VEHRRAARRQQRRISVGLEQQPTVQQLARPITITNIVSVSTCMRALRGSVRRLP